MTEEKVSKEFLLHLYDATWEDIRHSRMQEWKVLEVIALSFIALVGLGIQEAFRDVSIIFGIFIIIFAILGFFVTLFVGNLQNNSCWSSSTHAANNPYVWTVDMFYGNANADAKPHNYYVWPVQGGH